MNLKQIQEEELKLVDKTLSREEISKLLVEYSMPTRQVFISELINRINRFILSAMEASAKGAIEDYRQQLLKAVEEIETKYLSSCGDECITPMADDIRDLLKADLLSES